MATGLEDAVTDERYNALNEKFQQQLKLLHQLHKELQVWLKRMKGTAL